MKEASPETYSQYLSAKKDVDDRALNRFVWRTLRTRLPLSEADRPVRVIELGGGIGTMLERVIEWRLTPYLDYTFSELNPDHVEAFWSRIVQWSRERHYRLELSPGGKARLEYPGGMCTVTAIAADLYDIIGRFGSSNYWDLLVAHAVMDLVNLDEVLPGCCGLVKPGGLLYLSLNYDGHTEFLPPWEDAFEAEILERYHHSMEHRGIKGRPTGASRTGRRLFAKLKTLQIPVLAVGSSDWIVHGSDGGYPGKGDLFLDMIIETIWQELHRDTHLDHERLAAWANRRRSQIRSGELVYMARNLDFLAGALNDDRVRVGF